MQVNMLGADSGGGLSDGSGRVPGGPMLQGTEGGGGGNAEQEHADSVDGQDPSHGVSGAAAANDQVGTGATMRGRLTGTVQDASGQMSGAAPPASSAWSEKKKKKEKSMP
eukprot:scaffold286159_cov20-Tisochrysis_lutea.AAC.2